MTEPVAARTVVFIHGLWLHATSWQPWMDLFRAEGHSPCEVADASLAWLRKQGL